MRKARLFANGAIKAAIQDDTGALIIDNDRRKNALSLAMWRAIPDAMDWFHEQASRAVILMGAGERDFSAGADISEFDVVRADAGQARLYEAQNSAAFAAIRNAHMPVIAAIRGVCYGGAMGLAAAADLRLADDTAVFAIPAARLGLAYPADAVEDLLRGLGRQMVRRALFTGAAFRAEQMLACGFLSEIVAPGELEAQALLLAQTISANAPLSVASAKLALLAAESGDDGLLREATVLGASTFESSDYREGRAAFREKRPPRFTGG
ncbi:enoyl-CoA hydratase-related protein [Allorhizobium undicola]|uniref:enoyl-CoA hydratase-related protein n=1 Tax=Allorhizobium undicola TaxID=78527 RepID=UPI0004828C6A|nr:enoyl-CoA hydratase-related protein [Allorhizobium undicola]